MSSLTTWLTEFGHALQTLPRNPYLRHQIAKIWTRQRLLMIGVGYLIFTIVPAAYNWSIMGPSLRISPFLLFDLVVQTTYLQQISLFFLVLLIGLPLMSVSRIIKEYMQNRLPFVRLTPLTYHQIVVGIISRDLFVVLVGMLFFMPITLLALLCSDVTLSFVAAIMSDLLITALFAIILALIAGLFCHKNIMIGLSFVLIFAISSVAWYEIIVAKYLDQPNVQTYAKSNPFRIISTQGIQTAPMRVQLFYIPMNTALPYFEFVQGHYRKLESTGMSRTMWYKSDHRYITSVALLTQAVSEQSSTNSGRQSKILKSIQQLDASLQQFEAVLVALAASLNQKESNPFTVNWWNASLIPNVHEVQNLFQTLRDRKHYASSWLYLLNGLQKEQKLSPSVIRSPQVIRYPLWAEGFPQRRRYLQQIRAYQSKLVFRSGQWRKIELQDLNNLFYLDAAIELKNLRQVIATITHARRILGQEELLRRPETFHVILRDLPFLCRFAETASWWEYLDQAEAYQHLNELQDHWRIVAAELLKVKLPTSLLTTNCIGSTVQPQKIWRLFFYSIFIKLIIIVVGYVFLHDKLFSPAPLYFSPLYSVFFAGIFSMIFSHLYTNLDVETYLAVFFDMRGVDLYETLNAFMIALLMSIPFLLLYHAMPLSQTTARRWRIVQSLIAVFSFLLLVFVIWRSMTPETPNVERFMRFFLYGLIGFECARQAMSFKLTKSRAGMVAIGAALLLNGIANFFQ